ncbi:MAG: DapH/DapD/GlmU-related protein [Bacillota bacterium]|jgi:bifunctional UDP-N-acetylglucosamine pyrophosphorylase/glucosamine-1-phosphate N-acetyltransferase|nr:DapH/DapD/GlmU-related protein [Bacillota bacterium]HHU43877.1 hypothetical protein [Clostridiales bacterium]
MIDIYVMDEDRFEKVDILGKTPKELLTDNLKDNYKTVKSIDEIEEKSEYTALLYQDTPLVDMDFLYELCQKGEGFRLGDGFIKRKGYKGKLKSIDDIRAIQIKKLCDIGPIFNFLREKVKEYYKDKDILFYDIDSCYIDLTVEIGEGTIVHPMVTLKGKTKIGKNCVLFSQNEIIDTIVGNCVDIRSSYSLDAEIGDYTTVGPFACLRKGAKIGAYCRVGDFVEIKNSIIGDNTKMAHLAYVGDSTVGNNTNVGCGAVFANYNGKIKQRCTVGSNVFIGANSNLVAPVVVNDGAYIAAGSTVTHDVPGGNLCIARSRQVLKDNWERK